MHTHKEQLRIAREVARLLMEAESKVRHLTEEHRDLKDRVRVAMLSARTAVHHEDVMVRAGLK